MAKNLTYKRSTTETIKIKGVLDETASIITYVDEDKNEQTIEVQQLLNNFCSMPIDLTLKRQEEEELDIEPEVDEISDDAMFDIEE